MSVETRHLTVREGSVTILSGVDLHVSEGSMTVLTGPSGCGKSTVLRALMGLVIPVAGEVRIAGETMTPSSVWRLRRLIGYVPQEPELGAGIVREWLMGPHGYRANRDGAGRSHDLDSTAARLRLPEALLAQRIRDLSGGEKQRVALLGALLLDRRILLLDEPTSALDSEVRAEVATMIASLDDRTRLAVLHEPAHFPFADRTIVMRREGEW